MTRPTITDDKTINALVKFVNSKPANTWGYHYAIALEGEENHKGLYIHEMRQQPCLGELRPYGEMDKIYRPGDLTRPWPKTGNPVALAIETPVGAAISPEFFKSFFMEGPWSSAFPTEPVWVFDDSKKHIKGMVVVNTKVSCDTLINAFGNVRNLTGARENTFKSLLKDGFSPLEAHVLVGTWISKVKDSYSFPTYSHGGWFNKPNISAALRCDPPKAMKKTFFERGAYNRPIIENIWNDGKNQLKFTGGVHLETIKEELQTFAANS